MSKPYMPLFIGDYQRDTDDLSTEEHGAYLLLIMHYWNTGPLLDDHDGLARICRLRTGAGWHRVWNKISRYFTLSEDLANGRMELVRRWHHKRIDRELEKAENIKIKRAIAGSRGGRMSRGRTNVERHIIAQQLLNQMGGYPNKERKKTSSSLLSERPPEPVEPAPPPPEPAAPPQAASEGSIDTLAAIRSKPPSAVTLAEYAELLRARREARQ